MVYIFRKLAKIRLQKKHRVRSLQEHTEDVGKIHGLNRKNGVDIRRGIDLWLST